MVDSSNNIWFTENSSAVALIGEYTSSGTLNEYKISDNPPGGLTPHLITVDSNSNIWWTEGWVGKLGKLNRAQAVPGTNNGVTEYAYQKVCGSCGTHTSGIGVDGYGQIWFDDSQQSIFGSFPDTGTGSFSLYQTPTQNAHPHDGLNVDSQNRIWFSEEFANKLAVAVQNSIPTPTPTSSSTMTPSLSPSPGLTPSPTVGTTLAQDTFQRANQALWGTASDGHTWGGDANTASAFSIVNNTGQVATANGIYNAVLGATATDADVLLSGSLSSYSNSNLGAVLRWNDPNNLYKAFLSGTSLIIQKRFHNATTTLGSVPFAATAGTSYTLRFHVVGNTLSAKAWQTGSSEPASWMVMVTDTSFSSGFCGLRMLTQNGVTASYTSFQALSE